MKIRCIAIDDEPLALKQITGYIEKTPFLELTGKCKNAFDALELLSEKEADLLFVDINMPGLTGMEFVKSLRSQQMVIFTTAYDEYALEGFKVNAIDYLLKPISFPDFLESANKAKRQFDLHNNKPAKTESDEAYLFVKSDSKIVKVLIDNISYIEGMREYVRIYLNGSKPVITLLSLKSLEAQLPESKFMRVHKSYIVNLNQVTTIERNRIVFDKDTYIPVSDHYKEAFQEFIKSNFL